MFQMINNLLSISQREIELSEKIKFSTEKTENDITIFYQNNQLFSKINFQK